MTGLWNAFDANAETDPAAPALIFGDTACSFGELKVLAQRCAAALAGRGVVQGDVVALQLPKRRMAYALLLACLRLGAPYVFLDPKNPPERTARMVAQLRPKILFSETGTPNPFGEARTLASAGDESSLKGFEPAADDAAFPIVTGTDPAYIMFTSGSTGEPKGAVIPHRGVLSLMAWARTLLGDPARQRFTGLNPLHFDNSVFDIYCGLLNGAALVPVETSEITNPATWVRTVRAAEATVMFAVPTLYLILDQLGLLTPKALPGIRVFQFGGEGYPIGKLRQFRERFATPVRLVNVYGPTETSCICSSIEITPKVLTALDREFPPLGRMHPDFTHAILDERQMPVPHGQAGELWIGGPCVGLGYYAMPEETAARFRQDPGQDDRRAVYYRSGDRVREDEQGLLWFQGRVDNQVKIRGHRIELEEIDLAVQSIPDVQRAVAVVLAGTDGGEIAVAYIANRPVTAEEVQVVCRQKLPAYMRPVQTVQFDELPHNANGKVDRRAALALLEQADRG
ncbi:MAG TPA: amino acid adenylation domain-containing protein [Bradyrhizobium sp.]|jgi:D-alanine--poly(phosphoribitol) ligase subunit 1|uniref:amino acid adenylation domain-containing protein n=1 Tax=Bradyrhizobium sp. TaxID=376 RepID=UPI002CE473D7|nr:amino acid adenylation domain-containing protein [Bradyrhizobium sp.]HTB01910.1 amino acid adenylation domain-containing protein [Bradyrhizobium sp.]